jgi:hypothetical protein
MATVTVTDITYPGETWSDIEREEPLDLRRDRVKVEALNRYRDTTHVNEKTGYRHTPVTPWERLSPAEASARLRHLWMAGRVMEFFEEESIDP